MDNHMFNRQIELEAESLNLGITRYRRHRSDKDESDLQPGSYLVRKTLDGLVDRIEAEVDAISGGKARRGKPSIWGQYLQIVDPDAAAYITAKVCINTLGKHNATLTTTAMTVSTLIEEHLVFTDLSNTQPALFNSSQRKVKRATQAHHKRYTMRHAVRVATENHPETVSGLSWSPTEHLHFGTKLVEMFIESTGLIELVEITRSNRRIKVLRSTEKTREWLDKAHARCELQAPVHLPTIIPPKDWTNPLSGGYHSPVGRTKLVKTKQAGTLDELFSTDMPAVYAAVNLIQSTPWRINAAVLDVMSELVDNQSEIADLPMGKDKVPFPAKLKNMDKEATAKSAAFMEWKKRTAEAHDIEARNDSRLVSLAQQLFVAKKMRAEVAIYFPHNLDFRGRIYPLPTGLNPQGDDRSKGLLEFANGKPLGEDGAYWLAVHIANLFGEDKIALDERVAWVQENQDAILDSAFSPLDGARFWTEADNPFCALAACFEWAGYCVEGDAYVSHLPIAMDGTCSGLQHYSALLRDPSGAAAVNLVPQDSPSDIYTAVALAVQRRVDSEGDPAGLPWLGRVERKIVKQPCMTFAYSATVVGMRDQIIAALRKLDDRGNALDGHDYFKAAQYLAPIVREEICNLVVAASAAMSWLQDCSKLCSTENQPIVWATPIGLPVRQASMKSKQKMVELVFQGQRMRLTLRHDTKKIDGRSQTNGIAPNYIHSLDSSHLMLTVLAANADLGIDSFAMIHDSFGTHACDTSAFNAVLRNEFVSMYTPALLERFRDDLIAQLPPGTDVPPVPAMGTFDIEAVMDSDFFFS